jgi:hypothetical protein
MLDWFNYLYKHSYCNDSKWFARPRRRCCWRSSVGFGWPWRWHLLCALGIGFYPEYFARSAQHAPLAKFGRVSHPTRLSMLVLTIRLCFD